MAKKNNTIDITKTGPLGFRQLQSENSLDSKELSPEFQKFREDLEKTYPYASLFDPYAQSEQRIASPLNDSATPWGQSRFDESSATEEDFQHLLSFISEDYFDNIALFEYHDEPLAPSYKFKNKVDDETIRERFERANTLVNELL